MKKIKNLALIIIALLLGLTSCNKFLDVQPEDKLMREQIVASEYATNSALNGIYLRMGINELYGSYMTMSAVECLAQAYMAPNDQSQWFYLRNYQYTHERAKPVISALWEHLYVQALATNDFLDILDNLEYTMSERRKDLLRGEVLALRAFYHFDIMRLFAPQPKEATFATELCMVYNTSHEGKVQPLVTGDSVMNSIIEDLLEAEKLLENDPIRLSGVIPIDNATGDVITDFYQIGRHYRMNYYAVKALQARVYLYKASYDREAYLLAKEAAQIVVNEAENFFPWVTSAAIRSGYNPDRILSTEIIFGIHSQDMYNRYTNMFLPTLSAQSELRPNIVWLTNFYEANPNDIRFSSIWLEAGGEKAGQKCCYKYAPPNLRDNKNYPIKAEFQQPLIRKSEIYYILAECEAETGDPGIARGYLDSVRMHRGEMGPIATSVNSTDAVHEEILKEYRKEFYSEGHMWFYYKRRGIEQIPDMSTETGTRTPAYRLPMPEEEIKTRE